MTTRTRLLRAAHALALALLAAACGGEPPPRHVLLVTLDTARADRFGHLGGRPDVTPRVDALAAEGTAFTDCWTPRGQTWPALASLLTSRYPLAHGAIENGLAADPAVAGLPEVLRHAGMRTGAFLSNACEAWGADRFDVLVCSRRRSELDGDQSRLQHAWDARAVDAAIDWLDSDAPSFAWVHLYYPHKPWPTLDAERARFLDPAYDGPWVPVLGEASVRHAMPFHDRVETACLLGVPPEGADREAMLAQYDAGMWATDREVGRLLDGLAARGRLDDTLVVLTTDHGEELFDHGDYPYHGAAIHGSTLRVPLVLRHPRLVPAGRRADGAASLLDVLPTVCELLDLPLPGRVDGRSLVPAFTGALPDTVHLSEALDVSLTPVELRGEVLAIRRGDWRLVWNPDDVGIPKPPWRADGSLGPGLVHPTALYDLAADPGETTDVAAEHPALVQELSEELARRWEELEGQARGLRPPPADVLRALESLGYLEGR